VRAGARELPESSRRGLAFRAISMITGAGSRDRRIDGRGDGGA
jgi:hypothetical protein